MRIVVTGATGNIGSRLIELLAEDPTVDAAVGVARRLPDGGVVGEGFHTADLATDDLDPIVAGADVVVHLAWMLQPSHDQALMWRTNVIGTQRLLAACARSGVGAIVHSSSVGAYAPGPKDRAVDESWATDGIATSPYSVMKAYVERVLDTFEREHPEVRLVRVRPGLVLSSAAASEQRRLFLGPLVPGRIIRPSSIPFIPDIPGLRTQAVHSHDAAAAFRLAALDDDFRGAVNVAADPVLGPAELAAALGARVLPVPAVARPLVRGAAALTWTLRLQPTDPGWVDLLLQSPVMDTTRATIELGWKAEVPATAAVREVVQGMGDGGSAPTPPLHAGHL